MERCLSAMSSVMIRIPESVLEIELCWKKRGNEDVQLG